MLHRLDSQLKSIAAEGLSADEIYRRPDLYRPATQRRVAPGLFSCPVCCSSAAAFLPFGIVERRNALCPNCGSLERHRFLWLYLTRYTRLLRRLARVLHTAPEPCLGPRLRALPNLRYRSLDLFDPSADVQADLRDLPFDEGAFDLILSSHVLEHLIDDRPALGELVRILIPGGRAVIMVPYDSRLPQTEEGGHIGAPAERMARFGHPYHYRNYGADFPRRLAAAGLEVTCVSANQLLSPLRRRYFRLNNNFIFDCRRL
ncbi:MAG: methyltransferase domain-containing protein [Kiloniellaceae bacterium]